MGSLSANIEMLASVLAAPGAVPSQPVIDAFYRLGCSVHSEGPGGETATAVANVPPPPHE
jgi:hypothetical protein